MSAMMFAMAGINSGLNYLQARAQNEQIQRNNEEARRVGDRQQALTSVNINRAKEAALAQTIDIDTMRMQARSQAIVSAAAAGTAGMSVNDSILDIERNAAKSEANVMNQLNDTIFNLEESRASIEANVRNRTILSPRPSAPAALFNAAITGASATYGSTWDFQSLGI